jgi:hypothetical protein
MSGIVHLLLINAPPQGVSVTLTQTHKLIVTVAGQKMQTPGEISGIGFTLDKTLYIVKPLYIKTGLTGVTET